MPLSQWLLLVFLSLLWGGSFLFNGIAVQELPLLTIVMARVGLGTLLLTAVVYAMGLRLPRGWAAWQPFLVMALFNNVLPFILIVRGQQEIASGLASILYATTPLFVVIGAHFFFTDEKANVRKIVGVLIGICGVAILVGPEALFGSPSSLFGMVCMLAAAISYAIAGLWARRFKSIPLPIAAACPLICATVILLPLTLAIDRPWTLPVPSAATVWSLLGLAVLSTALGYIVFFRLMAVSGATNSMLVTLLVPVSAVTFGTVLLGETLLPRHIAGAVVIGAALLLLDGRVLRFVNRASLRPADQ
jgi:drug/metabolite transporter (DMT)-like permease